MTHMMTLTAVSKNSKTGPMPTTSRGQQTCPKSCPFIVKGCYGNGRLFAAADKWGKPIDREGMVSLLAGARRDARYLRDRVVGDVLDPATGEVDYAYLDDVTHAATSQDLVPYGYSHAWEALDVDRIPDGYVMNASCETPEQVSRALAMGLDATIVNDDLPEGTMIDRHRVVTCPEQTRGVTCSDCGLCAKPGRTAVIRFLTHGPQKKAARAAVEQANADDREPSDDEVNEAWDIYNLTGRWPEGF